jgi:cytochrome c-type biogenesis protein CcmH/NrfF
MTDKKITVSWLNRIRKGITDGKNSDEILHDLVNKYGFEVEQKINAGFGHVLTWDEYVNSFDTELDYHELVTER